MDWTGEEELGTAALGVEIELRCKGCDGPVMLRRSTRTGRRELGCWSCNAWTLATDFLQSLRDALGAS